jgi:hypothetical protein
VKRDRMRPVVRLARRSCSNLVACLAVWDIALPVAAQDTERHAAAEEFLAAQQPRALTWSPDGSISAYQIAGPGIRPCGTYLRIRCGAPNKTLEMFETRGRPILRLGVLQTPF